MTYTFLGVNDEKTECEKCGKLYLKRVVWLMDENGKEWAFGTTCAARALGIKSKTKASQENAIFDLAVEAMKTTKAIIWNGDKYDVSSINETNKTINAYPHGLPKTYTREGKFRITGTMVKMSRLTIIPLSKKQNISIAYS